MTFPRRLVVQSEWNPRARRFRVKLACGHWEFARAVKGGQAPKACGCFMCVVLKDSAQ